MDELSLHQQALTASRRAESIVSQMKPDDPVRDWYQLELRALTVDETDAKLTLAEANARLGALRQLLYLMRDHCIRVQNPEYEELDGDIPDSFSTMQARLPSNVLDSARELGFTIAPTLLHDPAMENAAFDPVSPTAKVVAYLRGLDSSLNIATEFSPETDGEGLLQTLGITDAEVQASMAVLFQSRYHAMNAVISGREHSAKQIIEFASGISPRGYQWARMSPRSIYVESDLPQLMIHKAKLIRDACLRASAKGRGVHHCCAADVLNRDSVFAAIENLDTTSPFTMVTEGLLLYFNDAEMNQFLTNIQAVLEQYPGARWVTDFVTRQNLVELCDSHPGVAAAVRAVFSQTGREVVPSNPFQTDDCIRHRLAEHGMTSEATIPLADVTSTLNLEIGQTQRELIVGSRRIWCLNARQS